MGEEWLFQNPQEIGRIDVNNEPIVMELDESKYLQLVVTVGGTIITSNNGEIASILVQSSFMNKTVDPQDPEMHTQNAENLWMHAKRKVRR